MRRELPFDETFIRSFSSRRCEPDWMLQLRLEAFDAFFHLPTPQGHPHLLENTLQTLDLHAFTQQDKAASNLRLDDLLEPTFDHLKGHWASQEVIFTDTNTALQEHSQLFQTYFASCIQPDDTLFAALNMMLWSGGTFLYIPKHVRLEAPIHSDFRTHTTKFGQFERTLVIADEGSSVQYIEGCTAPAKRKDSLQTVAVEVIVKKDANFQYTTIQNWSDNVYNIATKRMRVSESGIGQWTDAHIGSKITLAHPSIALEGNHSEGKLFCLTLSKHQQYKDTGGSVLHRSPQTKSTLVSKSVSFYGGHSIARTSIEGLEQTHKSTSFLEFKSLVLDDISYAESAHNNLFSKTSSATHLNEDQLFYLMSRGLPRSEATILLVQGFVESIAKQLPLEYAVEITRLITLSLEPSTQ